MLVIAFFLVEEAFISSLALLNSAPQIHIQDRHTKKILRLIS